QQGRKSTAGSGLRTRGQTGLAANFRQNAPEIHASLVSPGALVGGDEVSMAVFHELSRAEGPSQQTANFRQSAPEIHASFRFAAYPWPAFPKTVQHTARLTGKPPVWDTTVKWRKY